MKGRTYRYFSDPLYAFGYGLSYTTFEIVLEGRGERVEGRDYLSTSETGSNISLPSTLYLLPSITIKNTGNHEGTEVVQVYVRRCDDVDGPLKTLKAFERVTLKSGETRQVEIKLDEDAFTLFDPSTNTMRAVPGKYEIFVGSSSRPEDLQKLEIEI